MFLNIAYTTVSVALPCLRGTPIYSSTNANVLMTIQAIIFDAYGTLFDVYSIGVTAEKLFPGKGEAIAALWRDKQIDYTRLRSLSSTYKPFWDVTTDALVFTCRKLGLELSLDARDALMAQYAKLSAFPENRAVLEPLQQQGYKLAILTNANPEMIELVVKSAGMESLFDHLLSVDSVRIFKTAPEAYRLGTETYGLAAKDILFVSSNCWDVCGASWFGYTTFWVNRANAPLEELGVTPDGVGHSLNDLLKFVEQRQA
jgi:2-haloacid dehalogenase